MSGWPGDFNISHSGDWIVCAVSARGRVGIDVEQILPLEFSTLVHSMSEDERNKLHELPPEEFITFFYKLWTLKESFVKAVGTGFAFSPSRITFDMHIWGREIRLKRKPDAMVSDWHFQLYTPCERYIIALCTDNQHLPSKIQVIDINSEIKGNILNLDW
ncbi:MAG: 4'-phosphopantetheinyl transferase superfamily protein [Alicyclobacillus sp.]|nr:4'-phosphopantetheinyl transferase superfamily protein [Alicyclobacillus sp.]